MAIVSDDSAPLLGPLRHAVPALLAGATVVVKPSPKAPSAAFALAELSARSAFPGGVFNVLHGDLAAIEGLCGLSEVSRLCFAGDPALGAKVAEIAFRYDKPCVD
ncbi:aldehyde dehydrogenase family protein [Candidatus Accumulibacter phosphatis]|uniref:Aldehyde dehydrogenase family protein n=1 Tax=Candidatus Accumulibacter phosphatis TaxID=327160 RepID=A0ABX1TV53_9PROT|nr:aldehyde dehydrogenase family protein [Candidatus Accumulibacter phosphatis]